MTNETITAKRYTMTDTTTGKLRVYPIEDETPQDRRKAAPMGHLPQRNKTGTLLAALASVEGGLE